MKKVVYFLIPLIIGGIFAFGLNNFLDHKINELLKSKDLVPLMGQYSSDAKDTGVLINNHFLENEDIMMIGASDLIHSTRQHPAYFFNTNRSKNKVFTIGRSLTQEIQDAIELGSTDPNIKNKKVVLLVAFSWFVYPDGIRPKDFQGRFSPVQFYSFFNNPEISDENKEKLAKRLTTLLNGSDEYKAEKLYATLYNSDEFIDKVQRVILSPYFKLREGMVTLKEKGLLYLDLRKLKDKQEENNELKEINWDKEFKLAVSDSKKRVKDNPFDVDQDYYDKTLKDKLPRLKNKYGKVDIVNSKEIEDYEYFLDVCKDLGVDPTIVIVPGLPKYYAYTGVPVEEQHKLYDKIEKLATDRGFDVINTKDEAGKKYYMRDVMHLGTVGWTDVSKKLFEKYNQ